MLIENKQLKLLKLIGSHLLGKEQNYTYDKLGRLGNSTGDYKNGQDKYTGNYEYDDANRMKIKTEKVITYNYTYIKGTHAIDKVTGDNQTINFGYDDFGKMTCKKAIEKCKTEITSYNYNDADELVCVDEGNKRTEFEYSNSGKRIKKTYRDDCAIISESVYVNGFYTIKDKTINKHISDGKYIIATKLDNNKDKILYYHANHIGSTAMLTDKNGDVFQSYWYLPYGEMWVKEGSPSEEITRLFTGQEYDKETGMYYMNARYYDPSLAIFTTPDPAMDGLNHYAYANCNPIMYNDPTGLRVFYDGSELRDTDKEKEQQQQQQSSSTTKNLGLDFIFKQPKLDLKLDLNKKQDVKNQNNTPLVKNGNVDFSMPKTKNVGLSWALSLSLAPEILLTMGLSSGAISGAFAACTEAAPYVLGAALLGVIFWGGAYTMLTNENNMRLKVDACGDVGGDATIPILSKKRKKDFDPLKFDPWKDTNATTTQPTIPPKIKPPGEEPPPGLFPKILFYGAKIWEIFTKMQDYNHTGE